jgi:hypothetical protein
MTLEVTWSMRFDESSPVLRVRIHEEGKEIELEKSEFAFEAWQLVSPDHVPGNAATGIIIESNRPAFRNEKLLNFENVRVDPEFLRAGEEKRSPNHGTVQAMAASIYSLLETRVKNSNVNVRSLLLHQGSAVTTNCLVVDPKLDNSTIASIAEIPYWLNYLLRDVGWRGNLRLFNCNSLDVRNESAHKDLLEWSLSTSVIAQTLVLATSDDLAEKEELSSFASGFITNMEQAMSTGEASKNRPLADPRIKARTSGPFCREFKKQLTNVGNVGLRTWSRAIKKRERHGLYCWIGRRSARQANVGYYAGFIGVLWHWLSGEIVEKPHDDWRYVGQIAPDDLAAVPENGRITVILEVDEEGRVWTRVENDRRERMAILVNPTIPGGTRPGVTSLEVSNISCPMDLHGQSPQNKSLDWFVERVISDRFVVNRVRLRTQRRPGHEDVWGGEDIASTCQKELKGDRLYLRMIPPDMPHLRAFIENCLSDSQATGASDKER